MQKLIGLCLLILSLTYVSVIGQYIQLDGNKFIDENGSEFVPIVMNYRVEFAYEDSPGTITNSHIQRVSECTTNGQHCCGDIYNGPYNIEQDLREISNLGFNTIRLIFKPQKLMDRSGYKIRTESFPEGQDANFIYIQPPYDPQTNSEFAFYLDNLLTLIQLMDNLGLKVICPLTEDFETTIMDSYQDDLNDYIEAVATFINSSNLNNIIAYEFIGEPTYSIKHNIAETENTKCNICRIVNRWVETVNTYDSGRLTTLGTCNTDDPFQYGWDPNFANVDFVNVHLYPTRREDEYAFDVQQSLENSIHRYLNYFYLYDMGIRKPYIVGETSFRGSNYSIDAPYVFPTVQGTESDQKYFVDKTMPYILLKTNAAGYGWWVLKNEVYIGMQWGIERSDPNAPDPYDLYSGWAAYRKDVAQSFIDFSRDELVVDNSYVYGPSSGTYDDADIYYNPDLITPNNYSFTDGSSITHYGYIKGYVYDHNSLPIKGAVIHGCCFDGVDPQNAEPVLNSVTAITDDNGYFELYIEDRYPNSSPHTDTRFDRVFEDVKIAAFGAIPTERGWSGGAILDYEVYELPSLAFLLDETKSISGFSVAMGNTINYHANGILNIEDGIVEGNSEMTAYRIVNISSEFDAKPGCEVLIHNKSFQLSCDSIEEIENLGSKRRPLLNNENNPNGFIVFPTYTDNEFYIKLSNYRESVYSVSITDVAGRVIYNGMLNRPITTLGLGNQMDGVYFITVWSATFRGNKKIVKI